MSKTIVEKSEKGGLMLRPSPAARQQREARKRLLGLDTAHLRGAATLPELRAVVADVLEWLREGGEATT